MMLVKFGIRQMLFLRATSVWSPRSRQCSGVDFASNAVVVMSARKKNTLRRIKHRYRYKNEASRTLISDAETIGTRTNGSNTAAAAAIVKRSERIGGN
jgi:hypothetical protein